jgi:hypothetical protein
VSFASGAVETFPSHAVEKLDTAVSVITSGGRATVSGVGVEGEVVLSIAEALPVVNDIRIVASLSGSKSAGIAPVRVALVDKEDPSAVMELVSIVKAESGPQGWVRKNGSWSRDDSALLRIRQAKADRVVVLDEEKFANVMTQVDYSDAERPYRDSRDKEREKIKRKALRPVTKVPVVSAAPPAPATPAMWGEFGEVLVAAGGPDAQKKGARELARYWTHGAGAAKIRWGTGGDWTRCVRHLSKYLGTRSKGYCNLRHKEALGFYPAEHAKRMKAMKAAADPQVLHLPPEVFPSMGLVDLGSQPVVVVASLASYADAVTLPRLNRTSRLVPGYSYVVQDKTLHVLGYDDVSTWASKQAALAVVDGEVTLLTPTEEESA